MKKFLASLIVAVMLFTIVAPAIEARDDARLREAILFAKGLFPVTDSYKEFFTSQQTIEQTSIYFFEWRGAAADPAGFNPSSIGLSVDLGRKLVTNYSFQEATPRNRTVNYAPLPKFSQSEAQSTAEALAKRLAPSQFATMRLFQVHKPQVRIGQRQWPHHYTFNYIQYVNNIPFHGNSISISVNADSGEVTNYGLNFTEYTFPSPQGIIPLTRAGEAFKGVGLRLVYQRGFSWRQVDAEPFLAYVLEDGRMLSIDAFTGKVFSNPYFVSFPQGQDAGKAPGMARTESGLTPQELKEIELVEGLLPLERIDALAREIAFLPSIAELRSSRLFLDTNTEQRLWSLDFSWSTPENDGSANMMLDAANGTLESFYFWDKDGPMSKPTMTRAAALEIASRFLGRWVPDRYKDVVLVDEVPMTPYDEPSYSYGFVFSRKVNGIPVMGDNLFVTVRHDGRVVNYSSTWYRGTFVSPQGVLSGKQMSDKFLVDVGLELSYVLTSVEQKDGRTTLPQIRLVYQPKQLTSYLFDAFTGKNIDWQGKPIVDVIKPNYTDIAAHWAQNDIQLLVGLGLLRLPGNEFLPDQTINLGDMLSLFSVAAGWEDSVGIRFDWLSSIANERNISALNWAATGNLVREGETIDPEALVTRELLAFYLARLVGHGDTAALQGIWAAPFSDFSQVNPKYQGSVAIAHALRLMAGGSDGRFMPSNHTTRAQVVVILARMLRASN